MQTERKSQVSARKNASEACHHTISHLDLSTGTPLNLGVNNLIKAMAQLKELLNAKFLYCVAFDPAGIQQQLSNDFCAVLHAINQQILTEKSVDRAVTENDIAQVMYAFSNMPLIDVSESSASSLQAKLWYHFEALFLEPKHHRFSDQEIQALSNIAPMFNWLFIMLCPSSYMENQVNFFERYACVFKFITPIVKSCNFYERTIHYQPLKAFVKQAEQPLVNAESPGLTSASKSSGTLDSSHNFQFLFDAWLVHICIDQSFCIDSLGRLMTSQIPFCAKQIDPETRKKLNAHPSLDETLRFWVAISSWPVEVLMSLANSHENLTFAMALKLVHADLSVMEVNQLQTEQEAMRQLWTNAFKQLVTKHQDDGVANNIPPLHHESWYRPSNRKLSLQSEHYDFLEPMPYADALTHLPMALIKLLEKNYHAKKPKVHFGDFADFFVKNTISRDVKSVAASKVELNAELDTDNTKLFEWVDSTGLQNDPELAEHNEKIRILITFVADSIPHLAMLKPEYSYQISELENSLKSRLIGPKIGFNVLLEDCIGQPFFDLKAWVEKVYDNDQRLKVKSSQIYDYCLNLYEALDDLRNILVNDHWSSIPQIKRAVKKAFKYHEFKVIDHADRYDQPLHRAITQKTLDDYLSNMQNNRQGSQTYIKNRENFRKIVWHLYKLCQHDAFTKYDDVLLMNRYPRSKSNHPKCNNTIGYIIRKSNIFHTRLHHVWQPSAYKKCKDFQAQDSSNNFAVQFGNRMQFAHKMIAYLYRQKQWLESFDKSTTLKFSLVDIKLDAASCPTPTLMAHLQSILHHIFAKDVSGLIHKYAGYFMTFDQASSTRRAFLCIQDCLKHHDYGFVRWQPALITLENAFKKKYHNFKSLSVIIALQNDMNNLLQACLDDSNMSNRRPLSEDTLTNFILKMFRDANEILLLNEASSVESESKILAGGRKKQRQLLDHMVWCAPFTELLQTKTIQDLKFYDQFNLFVDLLAKVHHIRVDVPLHEASETRPLLSLPMHLLSLDIRMHPEYQQLQNTTDQVKSLMPENALKSIQQIEQQALSVQAKITPHLNYIEAVVHQLRPLAHFAHQLGEIFDKMAADLSYIHNQPIIAVDHAHEAKLATKDDAKQRIEYEAYLSMHSIIQSTDLKRLIPNLNDLYVRYGLSDKEKTNFKSFLISIELDVNALRHIQINGDEASNATLKFLKSTEALRCRIVEALSHFEQNKQTLQYTLDQTGQALKSQRARMQSLRDAINSNPLLSLAGDLIPDDATVSEPMQVTEVFTKHSDDLVLSLIESSLPVQNLAEEIRSNSTKQLASLVNLSEVVNLAKNPVLGNIIHLNICDRVHEIRTKVVGAKKAAYYAKGQKDSPEIKLLPSFNQLLDEAIASVIPPTLIERFKATLLPVETHSRKQAGTHLWRLASQMSLLSVGRQKLPFFPCLQPGQKQDDGEISFHTQIDIERKLFDPPEVRQAVTKISSHRYTLKRSDLRRHTQLWFSHMREVIDYIDIFYKKINEYERVHYKKRKFPKGHLGHVWMRILTFGVYKNYDLNAFIYLKQLQKLANCWFDDDALYFFWFRLSIQALYLNKQRQVSERPEGDLVAPLGFYLRAVIVHTLWQFSQTIECWDAYIDAYYASQPHWNADDPYAFKLAHKFSRALKQRFGKESLESLVRWPKQFETYCDRFERALSQRYDYHAPREIPDLVEPSAEFMIRIMSVRVADFVESKQDVNLSMGLGRIDYRPIFLPEDTQHFIQQCRETEAESRPLLTGGIQSMETERAPPSSAPRSAWSQLWAGIKSIFSFFIPRPAREYTPLSTPVEEEASTARTIPVSTICFPTALRAEHKRAAEERRKIMKI